MATLGSLAAAAALAGATFAAAVPSSLLGGLNRPHPKYIAGTAKSSSYSPKTYVYVETYSTEHSDDSGQYPANSVSQFVIPKADYPHSYTVSVKGGYVVSGSGDALLLIASARNAKTIHLLVKPA
jgi:Glycoside hydrolase family 5 C-terminal domain